MATPKPATLTQQMQAAERLVKKADQRGQNLTLTEALQQIAKADHERRQGGSKV